MFVRVLGTLNLLLAVLPIYDLVIAGVIGEAYDVLSIMGLAMPTEKLCLGTGLNPEAVFLIAS
jgi:hypothetical protein